MTIRFPAELPYYDSLPLITVGDLVNQGRIVEAVNFMQANQQACANALGAVNFWRAQFVPFTLVSVGVATTSNLPITYAPNTVYWYRPMRDGRASCSVSSGNNQVWCGVGDEPGSFQTAVYSNGGGTEYLPVIAGQYVSMRVDGIVEPVNGLYLLANP
jgi:hypothetical protein